jgi:tryptophan-rich sensory protein
MGKGVSILGWIVICLFLGYMSSIMQSEALVEWYPTLAHSPLTPPDWAFPLAWTVLYILMGISAGMLYGVRSIYTRFLYVLFAVQLVLNILWSFFFFYLRSPIMGFMDILLLDMFVLLYFVGAYVVKRSAALIMLPYILWLAFATYLNGYIMLYN